MTRSRVLVLGWIGSTNLGDELIAEEICRLVDEAGGDPSVATIDTSESARLGVPMIRHAGARDALRLARSLRHHHAAVFGGGGLVQDETGPLNLPFHLSRLGTARMLHRPWAGIGLGFGDVRRRSGRALVRATMRGAVGVSVRDTGSAQRCLDLTGTLPVVAADPVLARSVEEVEISDHLVVSLRRGNAAHQRRLRSSPPPDTARVERWARVIDAIAAPRGLGVRFVAWEREQDDALHRAVAARLHSPAVIETPSAGEIEQRMAAGRLVLTMRYHGAIAALLHGRPALVVDYSPKMADLVAECGKGLALAPVDVDPGRARELLDGTIDHADERAGALTRLRQRGDANTTVIEALVAAGRPRGAR